MNHIVDEWTRGADYHVPFGGLGDSSYGPREQDPCAVELMGVERLGIGSGLCQDQPDSVVEWIRLGRHHSRTGFAGFVTVIVGYAAHHADART